ncbi:MAG: ATP-binding cassette domain-containing protein [Zhongshania sp.]|uniref:ATP-binding cassette domain-containing protein n=1 Tax=Zhongshania sp. TaxID=1971902 RepID=UPI002603D56C|nr:ATP-binding cassette domain-containing protein [Zhongshania sp.]MDF1692108.1 ATP-binding cassette domain-containing protein [Zhongshania sp.]
MFELHKISLKYRKQTVLKDVSLTIRQGESVALVGPSGAGKSTLLKHLRSLQAAKVAWCPQHAGLVPMLSAYHNMYMGGLSRHSALYNLANLLRPLAIPKAELQTLAQSLALDAELYSRVDELSGGQQQRVAIGRALYQQQAIFIGDEPVSAVDAIQADKMLSLISQRHQTIVLALHDTEQALRVCQRIIGLKDGAIAFDLPSAQVTAEQLAALYQA